MEDALHAANEALQACLNAPTRSRPKRGELIGRSALLAGLSDLS
jgi:hypothetical protein